MTREYILQNLEIMCPIMFIDNPGLRDHVMSTLQDSLLIPKPRFKVGDRVTMKNNFIYDLVNERHYPVRIDNFYKMRTGTIVGVYSDIVNRKNFYAVCPDGKDSLEPGVHQYFYEPELELVEEKK